MTELMSIVHHFPYAGFFLLLVLGSIGLPVPEEATLLLCGYLIAQGSVEPVPALLFLYAGLLAGDFMIYYAGRTFGRKLLCHVCVQRILPEATRLKMESRFTKHGLLLILFGRHIIGFRSKLFLVAGAMGLSPVKFMAIDAVAAFISMCIVVSLGYTGNDLLNAAIQMPGWSADRLSSVGIAVCLFAITAAIAARWIRLRRESQCRTASAESDCRRAVAS